MVHSPARWPPYGRPETSRLLEVDHYMLHVRIKMRLSRCAASSQNTDADRGPGVVRSYDPRVAYRRYGLPDMDVCTSCLEGLNMRLGRLGSSRPRSSALETFEEALKSCVTCG
jgi:hypothetical protein